MDDDTTTMTTLPRPPMSRFVPRRRSAGLSLRWLAFVLAGLGLAGPVRASEAPEPVPDAPVAADGTSLVWSAFGTLGWAQSNRSWRYPRYIDESVKPGEGLLVAGGARVPIKDDFPKGALYDLFNTKPDEVAEAKRAARSPRGASRR